MPTPTMRRVYVWEFPVRLYHWVNFACVLTLIITGFIIGRPLSLPRSGEAYANYYFGTVRFVHFAAAFVFFFNFVGRLDPSVLRPRVAWAVGLVARLPSDVGSKPRRHRGWGSAPWPAGDGPRSGAVETRVKQLL